MEKLDQKNFTIIKNIKRYMCPACKSINVSNEENNGKEIKICNKCGCNNGDFIEY